MAQDCPSPACKNRSQPPSLAWDERVPNRVHATMQPVQAPHTRSAVDRIFAKPNLDQLGARYDPILSSGQRADLHIPSASLRFPVYMTGKCRLGRGTRGHGGEGAEGRRTSGALSVNFGCRVRGRGCAPRLPRRSPPRPRGSPPPPERWREPARRPSQKPRGCPWQRPARSRDAPRRATSR